MPTPIDSAHGSSFFDARECYLFLTADNQPLTADGFLSMDMGVFLMPDRPKRWSRTDPTYLWLSAHVPADRLDDELSARNPKKILFGKDMAYLADMALERIRLQNILYTPQFSGYVPEVWDSLSSVTCLSSMKLDLDRKWRCLSYLYPWSRWHAGGRHYHQMVNARCPYRKIDAATEEYLANTIMTSNVRLPSAWYILQAPYEYYSVDTSSLLSTGYYASVDWIAARDPHQYQLSSETISCAFYNLSCLSVVVGFEDMRTFRMYEKDWSLSVVDFDQYHRLSDYPPLEKPNYVLYQLMQHGMSADTHDPETIGAKWQYYKYEGYNTVASAILSLDVDDRLIPPKGYEYNVIVRYAYQQDDVYKTSPQTGHVGLYGIATLEHTGFETYEDIAQNIMDNFVKQHSAYTPIVDFSSPEGIHMSGYTNWSIQEKLLTLDAVTPYCKITNTERLWVPEPTAPGDADPL